MKMTSLFRLKHSSLYMSSQEKGIALVVALVLLVIATLTGLAGMRNVSLQEKMTANLYDRAIAMQAAEAALSSAAIALSDNTASVINCSDDLCPVVPADTFTGTESNWATASISNLNDDVHNANPQYYIQWLGQEAVPLTAQAGNCLQYGAASMCPAIRFNLYRVTARSAQPTTDNTRAIVVISRLARLPI